jgi:DNA mismatch endonuclease (patch repair protein)
MNALNTSVQRSAIMRSVKRKNTSAEIRVRKCAHQLGLRFRLHRKGLPGTPDVVFPKYSTVIFVHGCFWHRHKGCRKTTMPHTNSDFWEDKFKANIERDKRSKASLEKMGWRVEIIWECQTTDEISLMKRLIEIFIGLTH